MVALIILALTGLFLMIAGLYQVSRKAIAGVAVLSLIAAFAVNILDWDRGQLIFFGSEMALVDNYTIAFVGAILIMTIFLFLLSENYFNGIQNYLTEHYALYLFAVVVIICMVIFNNLAMLFIGIEILSVSLYVLAGSQKSNLRSNEAALKYFLMGSFATGIFLMGVALIYGATHSFHLSGIVAYYSSDTELSPLAFVGLFMILIGMSFKVSIAPFHFWTPDVYEGSPSFVTSFMATIVKIAGFASFFKLFYICFPAVSHHWTGLLAILSGLTITVGGMTAVTQKSVKRIFAYSSVAHAGYMLTVVMVGANSDDVLFYVIAYSIASIAAFGVLMLVEGQYGNTDIASFEGLVKKNPLLSFVLTVSVLSMAGIPLTAGFMAKFYVLSSAFNAGHGILVLVALVNAMVGIYYYFKIIIAANFVQPKVDNVQIQSSTFYNLILIVGTIATIVLGICPDLIHNLI